MPKPRVLEKYDVDESRCILCGICVDACPYDALRDGADIELSHTSRVEPMIDLLAIAAVDRETEVTYIRRERDWATRAAAEGRLTPDRLLPVLPGSIAGNGGPANGGNGHDPGGHGGHGGHGGNGQGGHGHGPGDHDAATAVGGGAGHG
jgi:ferredoxin